MNLKKLVISILCLLPLCELIPVILDFLEKQAKNTVTPVDDGVIAVLRLAFKAAFPSCFE